MQCKITYSKLLIVIHYCRYCNSHACRYASQLRMMFPERKVSQVLSKYLFVPTESLWARVTASFQDSHKSHPNGGNHANIGIQNRVFNVLQLDNTTAKAILGCVKVLTIGNNHTYLHLTSMHSQMAPTLRQFFTSANQSVSVMHKLPQVAMHDRVSGIHRSGVAEISHALSNLHDIYLLSLNDKILITRGSTMGYMAVALSNSKKSDYYFINSKPIFINSHFHHQYPTHENCTKMISTEPCMHFNMAFKPWLCEIYPHKNRTAMSGNISFAYNDVVRCQDFDLGMKLKTYF